MAENTYRGMRLGSQSLESTEGVKFEPRNRFTYKCASGHLTELAFSVEAEVPGTWECKVCSKDALLMQSGETVEPQDLGDKTPRSHWQMLLERRSLAELEEILQERLVAIRERRAALSAHSPN